MKHAMFSDAWARALGEQIAGSPPYREAARTWEWPLLLAVPADPRFGIGQDLAIYLDLWHGECRAARAASAADTESAPFVLTADAPTWKQVVDGSLDPLMGILRGKLKLARGRTATLLGYVRAAKELVACATRVETEFPPGL